MPSGAGIEEEERGGGDGDALDGALAAERQPAVGAIELHAPPVGAPLPALDAVTPSDVSHAVIKGDVLKLEQLLAGVDVDLLNDPPTLRLVEAEFPFLSALMHAGYFGRPDCLTLLLKAGSKLDLVDALGLSALMYAARFGTSFGHLECVTKLVQAGANLNVVDKKGNSALMHAVQHGSLEVIKVLIEAGAAPYLMNDEDCTAMQCVSKRRVGSRACPHIEEVRTILRTAYASDLQRRLALTAHVAELEAELASMRATACEAVEIMMEDRTDGGAASSDTAETTATRLLANLSPHPRATTHHPWQRALVCALCKLLADGDPSAAAAASAQLDAALRSEGGEQAPCELTLADQRYDRGPFAAFAATSAPTSTATDARHCRRAETGTAAALDDNCVVLGETTIRKRFVGFGWHAGTVVARAGDSSFRVVYDAGDEEHLSLDAVRRLMVAPASSRSVDDSSSSFSEYDAAEVGRRLRSAALGGSLASLDLPRAIEVRPNAHVEVRIIPDGQFLAGQFGAFARRDNRAPLPPGYLLPFAGDVVAEGRRSFEVTHSAHLMVYQNCQETISYC